jgi:hypothetical protein
MQTLQVLGRMARYFDGTSTRASQHQGRPRVERYWNGADLAAIADGRQVFCQSLKRTRHRRYRCLGPELTLQIACDEVSGGMPASGRVVPW